MEIWIYHYKVESELNQFRFFDLIDYEDCSSENLKRFFVNHIHDREYYELASHWAIWQKGASEKETPL
mgnify:CR=1 FL=1